MPRLNLLNTPRKKIVFMVVILFIFVLYFLFSTLFTPYSNSGVVTTHVISIAPVVGGTVTKVDVIDDQFLHLGDPIFSIDKRPYELKYYQAQNDVQLAHDQVLQFQHKILEATQNITQAEAELKNSTQKYNEIKTLTATGTERLRDLESATANLKSAQANLEKAKAQKLFYEAQLGKSINGKNIHVVSAENKLNLAKYYLDNTTIRAPEDGYVDNVNIQVGTYADPTQMKVAFIRVNDWWINALFKENTLRNIHRGSQALVIISSLPGQVFYAKVLSISHGIRQKEMLPTWYLPYIQANHEWIEKQNYFPVRLRLQDFSQDKQLRVGATAKVVILTDHGFLWNALAWFWMKLWSILHYLF